MPNKKIIKTRTSQKETPKRNKPSIEEIETVNNFEDSSVSLNSQNQPFISSVKKHSKLILVILILIAFLAGATYYFRSSILVAIVNNKPIFKFQLVKKLTASYGKEALENMIVEKLIEEEARNNKIIIGETDIDSEVDKVTKSLGANTKIEDLLTYQGMTMADFRNQLKLRLQVNKILENQIIINDEEIATYIKDNLKSLVASGEAERKLEAAGKLKEQKISEKIQTWVSELLAKAKITRFIK